MRARSRTRETRARVLGIAVTLGVMVAASRVIDWPAPGAERLRRTLSRDFIGFLRRSIEVRERRRFRDGVEMLEAFEELSERAIRKPRPRRTLR